jgi:hypothetical protein
MENLDAYGSDNEGQGYLEIKLVRRQCNERTPQARQRTRHTPRQGNLSIPPEGMKKTS